MIILDYQDRRPIYEQITEKFRVLILSGAIQPDEKLPSVRQLAVELSINPNTIQRAYMELEQQGLVYPVKGRGNFVANSAEVQRVGRKHYFCQLRELVAKGRDMGILKEEAEAILKACYREERR